MADPRDPMISPDEGKGADPKRHRNICACVGGLMLVFAFWSMEGCSPEIDELNRFELSQAEADGLPTALRACSQDVSGKPGALQISQQCSQPAPNSQLRTGK